MVIKSSENIDLCTEVGPVSMFVEIQMIDEPVINRVEYGPLEELVKHRFKDDECLRFSVPREHLNEVGHLLKAIAHEMIQESEA